MPKEKKEAVSPKTDEFAKLLAWSMSLGAVLAYIINAALPVVLSGFFPQVADMYAIIGGAGIGLLYAVGAGSQKRLI